MKKTLLTLALLAAVPAIANENAVQENTDSVEVTALPAAPDAQTTDAVDCSAQVTEDNASASTEQQPEITEEEFKKLIEDLIEKTKQEEEAKKAAQTTATA